MENYLIIMPAYNEASKIESLLVDMLPYRENTIIINDGSIDCTSSIIHKYKFECIDNIENFGVSKCIAQGIDYALENNVKKVILMDSDGQHSPVHIPMFLNKLAKHEFVFGCRYYENESIPTNKWASNLFAAALYAELTNRFFTDISCGFKGISLNDGLIRTIKDSKGYGVVYNIVNNALLTNADIAITPIRAIYSYSELLYTKSKEILALLNSVDNLRIMCDKKIFFKIEQTIGVVKNAIKCHEKFHVNVADVNFWAFPICEDGFIFQMDPKDISIWLKKCSYFEEAI